MQENPTFLLVAAGLLRDRHGRILLQQALSGKAHGGLWEFPGGKVEIGETPRAAMVREINEELGLAIPADALVPAGFADEAPVPGRRAIVLILYNCTVWSGEPEAHDGQVWGWFELSEAAKLPLAPLDRMLLEGLCRTVLA